MNKQNPFFPTSPEKEKSRDWQTPGLRSCLAETGGSWRLGGSCPQRHSPRHSPLTAFPAPRLSVVCHGPSPAFCCCFSRFPEWPPRLPSRLLTTVVWGCWWSFSTNLVESSLAGEGLT